MFQWHKVNRLVRAYSFWTERLSCGGSIATSRPPFMEIINSKSNINISDAITCTFTCSQVTSISESAPQLYSMPYAAKQQQFLRRRSNLLKKADQLARLCNADLALIICKNGRYYTYRSTDRESWPPSIKEIVCFELYNWIKLSSSGSSISFTCQFAS